jgi:murein DD-endopeptidase MepM/ murein hydrolase activator NlpD
MERAPEACGVKRRGLLLLAGLISGSLLAVQPAGATGDTPTASPTAPASGVPTELPTRPTPYPTASPSPNPTSDPNQALYDRLAARLRGDLAKAVADQQQLGSQLDQGRAQQQALSDQVDAATARIADLRDQVAQLDDQITTTQDQVDGERAQVAALARALYRRPSNWLVLLAHAKSLRDAFLEGTDAVIAGQRAHALQARLENDLAKLQADRGARQADLDQQTANETALEDAMSRLDGQLNVQDDISNQLLDLVAQIQDAIPALQDQDPDAAAALVDLLEAQLANLAAAEEQAAWSQAAAGSGRYQADGRLPVGQNPTNLKLAWPMPGAVLTQPFGLSDLVLEPPLGPYPHFHTGVDLAEPLGTPVLAAADGVVVAVSSGRVGYGNYVVIAHGQGVETLYGHLEAYIVKAGDSVNRGQLIGLEGSSGFSTGPHLHFEVRINGQPTDPMLYLS